MPGSPAGCPWAANQPLCAPFLICTVGWRGCPCPREASSAAPVANVSGWGNTRVACGVLAFTSSGAVNTLLCGSWPPSLKVSEFVLWSCQQRGRRCIVSVDRGEQSVLPTRTQLGIARGLRPASSPEPSPTPGIENLHISASVIAQNNLSRVSHLFI